GSASTTHQNPTKSPASNPATVNPATSDLRAIYKRPTGNPATHKQPTGIMPTSITTRQWYPKVYADEYTNTQLDIATDAIIPGQISTIAIDWMIQAEENGDFDIMLIQDFQETFAGWSLNHFNAMDMRVRTAVKNILRDRGVYIEKNSRNTIAQQLVNLLSLTRSPDWPIDELNVMRLNPDFKCRQIAEEAQHARTTQQSSNPPTQSA
ncbi:hypothetical protein A1F96_11147, partial [Pyrenophora tritici-repentis]